MSIAFLQGKVKYKSGGWIILEVGNIGYRVDMSTDGIRVEDELSLYIYHYFREDAQKLIGFKAAEQLEMFEVVTSVSGVGPKMGIALLDTFPVETIVGMIRAGNSTELSKVKGLGKKTAERIILELKSKIDDISFGLGLRLGEDSEYQSKEAPKVGEWDDAHSGLKGLGYSDREIEEALARVGEDIPREEWESTSSQAILRRALAYLVK